MYFLPVLPRGISNEMARHKEPPRTRNKSFFLSFMRHFPQIKKEGKRNSRKEKGREIQVSLFLLSFCSLHSLSMGPIHYRISWETRGLLPSDPSGDHTKEVIGGGLLSSGTPGLTAYLVNIPLFLGLLTLTA